MQDSLVERGRLQEFGLQLDCQSYSACPARVSRADKDREVHTTRTSHRRYMRMDCRTVSPTQRSCGRRCRGVSAEFSL